MAIESLNVQGFDDLYLEPLTVAAQGLPLGIGPITDLNSVHPEVYPYFDTEIHEAVLKGQQFKQADRYLGIVAKGLITNRLRVVPPEGRLGSFSYITPDTRYGIVELVSHLTGHENVDVIDFTRVKHLAGLMFNGSGVSTGAEMPKLLQQYLEIENAEAGKLPDSSTWVLWRSFNPDFVLPQMEERYMTPIVRRLPDILANPRYRCLEAGGLIPVAINRMFYSKNDSGTMDVEHRLHTPPYETLELIDLVRYAVFWRRIRGYAVAPHKLKRRRNAEADATLL